jgi:very-short-patch-repair endonuclease
LAIELDGDSHFTPEAIEYDRARTTDLGRFGIEVLRFTNLEVGENLEGVLTSIEAAVKRRRGTSPLPPPS